MPEKIKNQVQPAPTAIDCSQCWLEKLPTEKIIEELIRRKLITLDRETINFTKQLIEELKK